MLNDVVKDLSGYVGFKEYMTIPYMEELNLVDEDLCVKVLDKNTSVRITEYNSSIINTIPRFIGIIRLYVHPNIYDKAREVLLSKGII